MKDMIARIDASHARLIKEFDAYKPDALIIIGGDQTEMFDRSNVPQFMMFLGETAYSRPPGANGFRGGDDAPEYICDVDVELSKYLLNKLVKEEGFDIAFSTEIENFGRGHGLPHAFANLLSYIMTNTKVPTVLIYENTYDPPSLSAKRVYELGQAMARMLKTSPRRVAIIGSGGLAHDPGGKRSGWLDQPLDRWFLDKIANGEGKATQALYSYDSDTMVSGTGEIRAWITVAGAMEEMGSRAIVHDYIPAGKTVTGLSTAHWTTEEAAAPAR
jgi:protocatechuate 4,5-dioxygenase beta chain